MKYSTKSKISTGIAWFIAIVKQQSMIAYSIVAGKIAFRIQRQRSIRGQENRWLKHHQVMLKVMMMIAFITINSVNALRVKQMMPRRPAFWRDSLAMMCYANRNFSFNLHCQFKCGRESSSSPTGRRPYAWAFWRLEANATTGRRGGSARELVTRHITDDYFFDELETSSGRSMQTYGQSVKPPSSHRVWCDLHIEHSIWHCPCVYKQHSSFEWCQVPFVNQYLGTWHSAT